MYIMFDPDDKDDTYMYLKQSSKDEYEHNVKECKGSNMDCMVNDSDVIFTFCYVADSKFYSIFATPS